MKVLVFSHGSDIDGMGSIIISKLYFEEVDFYYSEIHNLDEQIINEINNKNIYKYDYVFVTDLTPKNETLDIIQNDKKLIDKFRVIDHHRTNYNRASTYPFVHITIEDEEGPTSATNLFYKYLIKKDLIEGKDIVKEYCELTRLEDTWKWKEQNNNLAHNLSHLYNILGRDNYVEAIINKLKNNNNFYLTKEEDLLVNNKINDIEKHINKYLNIMKEIELNNHKGVIVIIDYEYRNEFPEYLRENNYDYEFAMMVCFDHNSISFRNVHNCNVREIAETFGGGGHDKAASCYINEKIDKVYDILLERKDNV